MSPYDCEFLKNKRFGALFKTEEFESDSGDTDEDDNPIIYKSKKLIDQDVVLLSDTCDLDELSSKKGWQTFDESLSYYTDL